MGGYAPDLHGSPGNESAAIFSAKAPMLLVVIEQDRTVCGTRLARTQTRMTEQVFSSIFHEGNCGILEAHPKCTKGLWQANPDSS